LSLAALLGSDVKDAGGDTVGRLSDVVVRWAAGVPYPRMTAIVVVRANATSSLVPRRTGAWRACGRREATPSKRVREALRAYKPQSDRDAP
jgi:hypothetical protein